MSCSPGSPYNNVVYSRQSLQLCRSSTTSSLSSFFFFSSFFLFFFIFFFTCKRRLRRIHHVEAPHRLNAPVFNQCQLHKEEEDDQKKKNSRRKPSTVIWSCSMDDGASWSQLKWSVALNRRWSDVICTVNKGWSEMISSCQQKKWLDLQQIEKRWSDVMSNR